MEETDDGSESQYADRRGVLHLMNQLADTNPNEQRHFYLKYRLDKVHNDNDLLRKENEQLKERNNRQAKTIDNLYSLIEKGDWTALKNIIKEMNEADVPDIPPAPESEALAPDSKTEPFGPMPTADNMPF